MTEDMNEINRTSGWRKLYTYKIGLKKAIKFEKFKNIIDVKTDCSYLVIENEKGA